MKRTLVVAVLLTIFLIGIALSMILPMVIDYDPFLVGVYTLVPSVLVLILAVVAAATIKEPIVNISEL